MIQAADLREDGEVVSTKTVAKIMRDNQIRGISPRPWTPVTTIPDQVPHAIPDRVGRVFDRGALNLVWTSDLTYLATGQGWLYLCAVRDGCSRRVIGYAFSDSLHTDVVETALRRAVTFREGQTSEVIFHADRGCQGGFNRSSQHLDHGGVYRWQQGTGARRPAICPKARVGSGARTARCDRRCVRRDGRTPPGWCSGSSGG